MSNEVWQKIREAGIPRSVIRLVAAEADCCEITVACYLVEGDQPIGQKKVNRSRERAALVCKKKGISPITQKASGGVSW